MIDVGSFPALALGTLSVCVSVCVCVCVCVCVFVFACMRLGSKVNLDTKHSFQS